MGSAPGCDIRVPPALRGMLSLSQVPVGFPCGRLRCVLVGGNGTVARGVHVEQWSHIKAEGGTAPGCPEPAPQMGKQQDMLWQL